MPRAIPRVELVNRIIEGSEYVSMTECGAWARKSVYGWDVFRNFQRVACDVPDVFEAVRLMIEMSEDK